MSLRWIVVAAVAAVCNAAYGQEPMQPRADTGPQSSEAQDEIVVRGRMSERKRLRLELLRAEEIVFERFNAINSDDRFDIRCERRARANSNISERVCLSNARRALDAAIGQAMTRGARGEMGFSPDFFRAERVIWQERLEQELRRLTEQDPVLREAMVRWANARRALLDDMPERPTWTASVEVPNEDLAVEAERAVVVRIGTEPWVHPLVARTFTISDLDGRIRILELACAQNAVRLDFDEDMEWSVPASWGDCRVRVDGKRGTTFALLEFAAPSQP